MIDNRTAPYALLLLRVTLGLLFLAHGGMKLFVLTPAVTEQFFGSLGLPGFLAHVTIAAEIIGGIALVVGFMPRWASLVLIPFLLGAIATVHGPAGFFFTNPNGGWEYLALWVVAQIVIVLSGDGAYAAKASWNPFAAGTSR